MPHQSNLLTLHEIYTRTELWRIKSTTSKTTPINSLKIQAKLISYLSLKPFLK